MKAIEITKAGGPEVLALVDVARPEPKAGEILIEVHYGVNRPDCLQRAGLYNPPADASPLPGLEVSGVIAALGAGVSGWAVGDAVCALVAGGAMPIRHLPRRSRAACARWDGLARGGLLARDVLYGVVDVVMRGGLTAGERFLVHGGSSGIGTTAIQIAKALGAEVSPRRDRRRKSQLSRRSARAGSITARRISSRF